LRFLTSMEQRLTPDVVVTRGDVFDEPTFRGTRVFDLYQELFPPKERDKPKDIVRWVLSEDIGKLRCFTLNGEEICYRLDSRYFILRVKGCAIGLGFFTYDYASDLLYCNYVGVQKEWREGGMAREFYLEMISMLDELFPQNIGVVIEVEQFDRNKLEAIIGDLKRTGGKQRLDKKQQAEIRKFLRVRCYQKLGYTFFVDARSGRSLSCRSPCLDPSLPQSAWAGEEEDYWLMWHPRIGTPPADSDASKLWRQAVEAIYVEILAKSLVAADADPDRRRGYWDYANALVAQTLRQGATDVSLATYPGPSDSELLSRWQSLAIRLPI
jgi:hypothetical protein